MKRTIAINLLFGVLSCIVINASAQIPTVDICLRQKGPDTLQVNIIPDANFSGLFSSIQFTVKWLDGIGSTLAFPRFIAPINIAVYPNPAGPETVSGGFRYQKYAGFGFQQLSVPWVAGQEVTVSEIVVLDENTNSPKPISTENFEIANDAFSNTLVFNGIFYVELNSAERTGGVVVCAPNAFPVEWLSFTGEKVNEHDVQLDWVTGSETNSDYFVVEKKVGTNEFKEIGQVKANGTTTTPSTYSFLDQTGMGNVNTYRLSQVDLDGSINYSEHVEILFEFFENDKFVVYPSPADGHTFLQATGKLRGDAKFFLTDQTGRILFRGVLPEHAENVRINLANYAEGVYYVRSVAPNGKSYLNRILKKRN